MAIEETIHDDFFKNFIVATATISAIYDIPDKSGIYAFYHAFDFAENNLAMDINERVSKTVFTTKFIEDDSRKKFTIDICGKPVILSDNMHSFIKSVSMPKDRRNLKKLLLTCSILQCPDYIGYASSLQKRFQQHLESDNGFFAKYGNLRPQDEFLFICFPCSRDLARELESLLIQLCQPKFNTQRS
ncbi:GIY-YIG nuclease family protein [Nostoc sp. CHAB 5715]|uniref:GIY-YIG nuclease family protein n=1 Tax=Nostoc sp. CHAB 5715 TaxID=2780400 RepID=UPI001E543196|nr:GIY-YIG nuclease family protein [Nostoc sp. CHAB 5715]MCC5622201.1 GIY-YIG nuclease family protein [Nostoc sp. CHAB 5715]